MKRVVVGCVLAASLVLSLSTPPALALGAGGVAPEIGARDLSGHAVKLSALRGKVVLVDFWASWCAPCREEMPILESLYGKYKAQGFEVVGVSQDQQPGNMERFVAATKVTFPVVHDRAGAIADRYEPTKMPTSYLIDRRGVVRYVHAGFRAKDRKQLEAQIAQLLESK